jgi:hypothetical protein
MKKIAFTWLVALCATAAVQAQQVKAPALPPGSKMVRLAPGLNPDEARRSVRAHHHKGHVKKDFTRDDSVAPNPNANSHAGGKK